MVSAFDSKAQVRDQADSSKDTLLSPPPHPGVQMGTGEMLGKPDEMQGEEGGGGWAGKLVMD